MAAFVASSYVRIHILTSPPTPSDADLSLNRNIFIETALGYALTYISSITGPTISPASITILADNDYYSTPSSTTDPKPSRFHNYHTPLDRAHKTGLGSSAALVTAFTAALLTYYLPRSTFDLATSDTSTRRLHNLAQIAHCAAQGKVGSGFDIATAVYGTCLYRRFSPALLARSADPGTPGFAPALRHLIDESGPQKWDMEIHTDAAAIPPGLRLVMCDVATGSKTPGMVKQVLAWRAASPHAADALWTDLHAANEGLARELRALAAAASPAFGLERLQACFARIRHGIRAMGAASGVPIEPPAQTRLLDACAALPGVVGGVVPGAGGYDAVTLLIEDREETVAALEALLRGWEFEGDGSGGGKGSVRMLGVRQEREGVKVERVEAYAGWL